MDIRQLKYFIAIAEEGQITAAANRLRMAQPPLSQQLKAMETELGFLLAERKGKSLELTDAGQKLYQHALRITDAMEEAVLEVKEAGTGKKGKLSIGVNTLSNYDLPRLLRTFQKRFPDVSYKIQQNESAQLCKLLKERVIDLAIVRLPLELNEFDIIPLKPEPFYFVTAELFHSKSSAITLEEISELPLIIPSTEGLGLFNKINTAFINRGLKPDIMCECSDISILFDLVSSKFGSTIVPETVVKLNALSNLQVYLIKDTEELGESGIISLKNHYLPKTAQHFIDLIHER
ncbi:LysR family transcriptional regulator [Bacillus sp. UMB0893]|uniref:LysR family transcriptional regulator n=1 Tax=Bacillus sp. UMB0893 TaxID=2066053 RepID=UPI000C7844CE|nr:LysR family transcriptional regulator [Bacillus sp. UMB0893]PLR67528.1 LysR family transcriptional regulator [Bacillus sp. UMB0893]QNG59820.1 LysR family transcriptional regulator [Bacillus sp. PAMC26568]